MSRFITVLMAITMMIIFCGCSQKVLYREYHAPTADTASKGEDGLTRGAVAKEVIKDGSPDWSSGDNKFNLNIKALELN